MLSANVRLVLCKSGRSPDGGGALPAAEVDASGSIEILLLSVSSDGRRQGEIIGGVQRAHRSLDCPGQVAGAGAHAFTQRQQWQQRTRVGQQSPGDAATLNRAAVVSAAIE